MVPRSTLEQAAVAASAAVAPTSPRKRRRDRPSSGISAGSLAPGANSCHPAARASGVTDGRFQDQRDVDERRRVAFLGDDLKKLLFGDAPAVGKQIFIGKVPFTVVGVMRHKVQNSSYMARDKDRVFIPASTFKALYGARYLNNIVFKVSDPNRSAETVRQVRAVVARQERFDPTDEDANPMWDTNDMMKMFAAIFVGFNLFLGILGFFTLLVGGIGVANIMFVVVRERTPEIGLKRSVGARRRDILFQFFSESLFIVSIGAAIGTEKYVHGLAATAARAPSGLPRG